MKPLYWKFLLILGAVIVGASLALPKALRKNAPLVESKFTQAIYLAQHQQGTNVQPVVPGGEISATLAKLKPALNINPVKLIEHKSARPGFTAKRAAGLVRPLNAGTRPTKMRVVK